MSPREATGDGPDWSAREISPSATQNTDEWVRCGGCGYELGGLPTAGACPECGLPIERSIRGDLLRYRRIASIERLERAFNCGRAGAWLIAAAAATAPFSSLLTGTPWLSTALGAAGILIVAIGSIRLVAAQRAIKPPARRSVTTWPAPISAGLGVLALIGLLALHRADPSSSAGGWTATAVTVGTALALGLLMWTLAARAASILTLTSADDCAGRARRWRDRGLSAIMLGTATTGAWVSSPPETVRLAAGLLALGSAGVLLAGVLIVLGEVRIALRDERAAALARISAPTTLAGQPRAGTTRIPVHERIGRETDGVH